VGEAVDGLIADAELDWRHERQARFVAGNVLDALAPSNFPWSNPAVVKEIVDQGGANLVKGLRNFLRVFPRLPSTVDTSAFAVGENLALTPGPPRRSPAARSRPRRSPTPRGAATSTARH
jgi:polyhydroxyalkanoate synthase